jgi:hypothetical protein
LQEAKKEYEELQIKLKELKDYIQVLEKVTLKKNRGITYIDHFFTEIY